MKIHVKLMGSLRDKSPAGNELEVQEKTSIADALRALDIADNQIQSVMINGRMETDRSRPLADNDNLMILAPVGGG